MHDALLHGRAWLTVPSTALTCPRVSGNRKSFASQVARGEALLRWLRTRPGRALSSTTTRQKRRRVALDAAVKEPPDAVARDLDAACRSSFSETIRFARNDIDSTSSAVLGRPGMLSRSANCLMNVVRDGCVANRLPNVIQIDRRCLTALVVGLMDPVDAPIPSSQATGPKSSVTCDRYQSAPTCP